MRGKRVKGSLSFSLFSYITPFSPSHSLALSISSFCLFFSLFFLLHTLLHALFFCLLSFCLFSFSLFLSLSFHITHFPPSFSPSNSFFFSFAVFFSISSSFFLSFFIFPSFILALSFSVFFFLMCHSIPLFFPSFLSLFLFFDLSLFSLSWVRSGSSRSP